MTRIYFYFKQILFYSILIVYIFLFTKLLLFKQVTPIELFSSERTVTRALEVIPFKTISEYLFSTHFNLWIALMEIAGNIVLFIPLGMYVQMFKRNKKTLNCVTLICVISLCVEITQYILGIGYSDIDDIILNTIGGLLGVFIYRIMYLVLKEDSKVRTAITFLWCIFGLCCFAFIRLSGLIIKI
ncbi:MAG: VanZ family protein [Chryseobacterium sp.]|jgi:glycopeptide antibiotics resistance protein|nr:VanZ family protein [Chryseobacterium sp.]